MQTDQKVCVITGASSGIGYAIAKTLAEKGFKVLATARREKRLKGLESVHIVAGDLNSFDLQDRIEEQVLDVYGRCDYLFNCAGVMEAAPIEEMDVDRMTNMLRLNIESTFRLTYKFLKQFKKQGYGHVVNISSILGTKVRPTTGAYAATKYAMEALSEALRMELAGTNIYISCIQPGLVMTELHDHWDVHPKDMFDIKSPLKVDDIVEAALFIMERPGHVNIPKILVLPKEQPL
ncbi:MAG: SDR family oxidoreductase [Eudoraea sp.]|nr:SDR family oxidoreductase [Eudoraea sp.]